MSRRFASHLRRVFRSLAVLGPYAIALTLATGLIGFTAQGTQATGGPVPHIDKVTGPPGPVESGQPFDVTIQVTNRGDDASSGSITVAAPQGDALAVMDADTRILPDDWTNCAVMDSHAWVVKPGAPCHQALRHQTACQAQITVAYPLAETFLRPWRAGESHLIRVRVFPRQDANQVTLYVRAALRAGTQGCNLILDPDDKGADATDQQGFPVTALSVAVTAPAVVPATVAPSPAATLAIQTPTLVPPTPVLPTATPVPPTATSLPSAQSATPARRPSSPSAAIVAAPVNPLLASTPPPPAPTMPAPAPSPVGRRALSIPALLGLVPIVLLGGILLWIVKRPQVAAPAVTMQPKPTVVLPPLTGECAHCGASQLPDARFCADCGAPLRIIGNRYQIVRQLGQGGMGSVWLVEDQRIPGKLWAAKEIREDRLATPAEQEQAMTAFLYEARLLAKLNHPNLPQVTDFLSEGGSHYLIMDYIQGSTLQELLASQGKPFPESQVLGWARQLASVLSYLHSQQPPIIFRDLKPENIMITANGRLKLIDFGIARLFKRGQFDDTTRFGTPGYAPPEQYGKGQTDARSDIYELGVVLYQLLTGYDPAGSPFVLPDVLQLNAKVSARTAAAIRRATQLNPAERFQTVAEMEEALGLSAKVWHNR